jgi:hypothetical protein
MKPLPPNIEDLNYAEVIEEARTEFVTACENLRLACVAYGNLIDATPEEIGKRLDKCDEISNWW